MYLTDLTVEAYGEYLRALFFVGGGVVFLRSMMEIRSIAAEGEADQIGWYDGMDDQNFYLADVINEWPLNGRIIEACVRIWSF